jgi:hypothetical protein
MTTGQRACNNTFSTDCTRALPGGKNGLQRQAKQVLMALACEDGFLPSDLPQAHGVKHQK